MKAIWSIGHHALIYKEIKTYFLLFQNYFQLGLIREYQAEIKYLKANKEKATEVSFLVFLISLIQLIFHSSCYRASLHTRPNIFTSMVLFVFRSTAN